MQELTRKQIAFCNEYVIDYNATQAALRAGYAKRGVEVQGCNLLKNIKIKAFIDQRKEQISKITDINIEKVVRELANISFSNVTDFIEVKGDEVTLTDWSLLTKDQTACVESVCKTKEGYRLKLYSKPAALEMLGKYFNMFNRIEEEYKEPDEFKDMTNDQLDRFISSNGEIQ